MTSEFRARDFDPLPSLADIRSNLSIPEIDRYLRERRSEAIRRFREDHSAENSKTVSAADIRYFMFQVMCDAIPTDRSGRPIGFPSAPIYTAMYQIYGAEISAIVARKAQVQP